METNGGTQEELFSPSSNQCPIWDDLNVLNHGANVDSLWLALPTQVVSWGLGLGGWG